MRYRGVEACCVLDAAADPVARARLKVVKRRRFMVNLPFCGTLRIDPPRSNRSQVHDPCQRPGEIAFRPSPENTRRAASYLHPANFLRSNWRFDMTWRPRTSSPAAAPVFSALVLLVAL